jgi:hypothetical protein
LASENPDPKWRDWFKWHAITVLLTAMDLQMHLQHLQKKQAFTEAFT